MSPCTGQRWPLSWRKASLDLSLSCPRWEDEDVKYTKKGFPITMPEFEQHNHFHAEMEVIETEQEIPLYGGNVTGAPLSTHCCVTWRPAASLVPPALSAWMNKDARSSRSSRERSAIIPCLALCGQTSLWWPSRISYEPTMMPRSTTFLLRAQPGNSLTRLASNTKSFAMEMSLPTI